MTFTSGNIMTVFPSDFEQHKAELRVTLWDCVQLSARSAQTVKISLVRMYVMHPTLAVEVMTMRSPSNDAVNNNASLYSRCWHTWNISSFYGG